MSNLTKTIEANGSKGHHKFSLIVEETYVGSGYQNTSDVSFTFKLSPIQNGWDWSGWASKITYKVTINGNEYTGSIGSYNGSSTVTLKSGSETIEHNSDGTKSISISFQVTDSSGQSYTCGNASKSDTFALSNIPRYATSNQSLSSATETSFTVSWWSDSTINALWYSIDNGANWVYINNPNSTSGSYTISNLEENRTYNVKTKVRRADSNLETQSSVGTWTTYSYPKPISSNNFTIGNGATVNLYNPLGRSVTLYILKVGENNNSNHLGYYSGTGNGYINYEFRTSDAISRQYASIPNNQNGKYYCRVVYGNITKDFVDNSNNTYSIAYNDNEKPVFDYSKISYTNSGSHSGFGDTNKFIKGHNNITITIQPMTSNTYANGDYYTISSSGISTQTRSHTGSNITVSNFGNLVTDSITVTATDKRQQSRSATVNVPWIDYFNPYISNADINRENAIGEKAVISLTGKYVNWSGLNVSNSIQTVKYKIIGIHNDFQNMPSNAVLTNQNGNWTLTATLQDTLSISNTYEIQFQFSDKLETITAGGYRIGTADALLWRDLQNKRIGIRKKPDYTFDINGDLGLSGNLYYGSGQRIDAPDYGFVHESNSNMIHKRNASSDYFGMFSNDQQKYVKIYPESGKVVTTGGVDSYNGLELFHETPYIDFHYNNSPYDYTSRIIEDGSGHLNMVANVNIAGTFTTNTWETENTTASWVPVWNGGYLEHRVIDANINNAMKSIERNITFKGGTGPGRSDWHAIGEIVYDYHQQGSFCYLKIILGQGNNGEGRQNAWIDLFMQLGWTGSNDGRFGCLAYYHPGKTNMNKNNTQIKVMANNNTDYGIYLYNEWGYSCPNVIAYLPQNAHFLQHDFWTSSPGGTQCDLIYDSDGGVILYDDWDNATNGNVTLNDYVSNYRYLEIYFRMGSTVGSQKVCFPQGASTVLTANENWINGNNRYLNIRTKTISISDNLITNVRNDWTQILNTNVNAHNSNNEIYIYRVVGYRN
jgi:hypothetical protein